jgi:hypothetical protein
MRGGHLHVSASSRTEAKIVREIEAVQSVIFSTDDLLHENG